MPEEAELPNTVPLGKVVPELPSVPLRPSFGWRGWLENDGLPPPVGGRDTNDGNPTDTC